MGVKWLETYVVPTIDGYKRAYGSVLCLTQVRFLPRPLITNKIRTQLDNIIK